MKKVQFKSNYSQYFFLAPQLGILLIFLYWPIIQTFRDAFTMQDAFGFGRQFVWFDNFLFIFDDPAYFIAFKFTIIYSFVITLVTGAIGLLLAVNANNVMHGKSAYKTLLIWPYAIAPAVVGVMANYFFSERFGLLYHLFNDMWGFNWYENVYDALTTADSRKGFPDLNHPRAGLHITNAHKARCTGLGYILRRTRC